jgi:hypothetical protein
MPGCVFHIVRVHRSVQLELRTAVFVAAGVVQRDSPLPELRRRVRGQLDQRVESSNRLGHAAVPEIGHSAVEGGLGGSCGWLSVGASGSAAEYEGERYHYHVPKVPKVLWVPKVLAVLKVLGVHEAFAPMR